MSKRANKNGSLPTIDLSYARAATILARLPERGAVTIFLVGCGGTGSYMAQHIGRLLHALRDKGTRARAVFVDHDRVEEKNIGRQLFCEAELGLNKAEALAYRYGTAWGLEIIAVPKRFDADLSSPAPRTLHEHTGGWHYDRLDDLTVIVGCVDNAAGRQEIARALKPNQPGRPPDLWWLDCGNHEDAGQVLLGTATSKKQLANGFPSKDICQALPAPSWQHPELLKAKREETAATRLSCAELAAANLQSLNINSRIAAEAADMLTRLLLTRNLKRFACELNLAAGSMRSLYATPEAVEAAVLKT